MLTGRGDLNAGAECRSTGLTHLAQEAFHLQGLVVRQALRVRLTIGWAAGLKAKPGGVLQGVGEAVGGVKHFVCAEI